MSVTTLRVAPRRAVWVGLASAALLFAVVSSGACGARSELDEYPQQLPQPECLVDSDCDGAGDACNPVMCDIQEDAGVPDPDGGPPKVFGICVALESKNCDDSDPCTNDDCEPASGECFYSLATLDNDGDGYRGPRVGTLPGAPGSCGEDCDDTSELAHPGGVEVCDGFDNDCNGIVDDNATFVPVGVETRVSGDVDPAAPAGLAYSGSSYAAVYSGETTGFDVYVSTLDATGQKLPPGEQLLTLKDADGSGGSIVWVGDRYGVVWQDRRDSDYEVYFSLLKESGEKALADQRLSFATGFSVNVSMAWNGAEFIAVWQDDRNGPFQLFGQRISVDGAPIGDNVDLTTDSGGLGNEAPSVAAGVKGVGVASSLGDAYTHIIQFQTFDPTLAPMSPPVMLTDGSTQSVYPTVVWNEDRYVIAWYDKSASPKAIYAAVVSEDGEVLVPPTAVSQPGPFRSRYPFLRPLGDRVLFVYSDDRDQNDGYELYARMIANDLSALGPEQRLTNAPKDSIGPVAAFGPDGNVGILFRDDREAGAHHVYFTGLACVAEL
jgi:hypothetical protein